MSGPDLDEQQCRRLRLCVLQPDLGGTEGAFKDVDLYCTPQVYDKEGKYEWGSAYIRKATAVAQVRDLARSKAWDVFINLCDGAWDEDSAGKEVVEALERFGCAYTGANLGFYEPSKDMMKAAAFYYDILTPPWALIMDVEMEDDGAASSQCQEATRGLTFPLIVKHYSGGGSVGMGRDCRVSDLPQLVAQVRKFTSSFGSALVEEFIAGREFTVLVVEDPANPEAPISLTPVEVLFGKGETFKHFDLKWRDYETLSWRPVDAKAEPKLDRDLRRAAADAFVALRGCSYGRADFRVDDQGKVYFLEHNPNCGIFYPPDAMGSADYILSLDPHMGHAAFIDHIVGAALARRRRQQASQLTTVRYRHGSGFGLYALRNIEPGEVVSQYEDRPHVLMSRKQATQRFGPAAIPGPSPADLVAAAGAAAAVTLLPSKAGIVGPAPKQQVQVQPAVPFAAAEQGVASKKKGHRGHAGASNFSSGSAPGVVSSFASGCPSEAGSGYESTTTATTSSMASATGRLQVLQRTGSSDSATDETSESGTTTAALHSSYCASAVALVAALELTPEGGSAQEAKGEEQQEAQEALQAKHTTLRPPMTKAGDGVEGVGLQQQQTCPGQSTGTAHASDVPDEEAEVPAGPVAERARSRQARWFHSYAYPITDETWVTWSSDPTEWLPLNHSCNPNTHLDGLNLVARRPIKQGEQVTADYATFVVHNMASFECNCGSPQCRGVVRGTDYLEPWVEEVYGDHVSDYVAAKRRVLKAATAKYALQ